ncbi:LuxR family transcriptional regulator [Pseudomonas syringae]|nr:LuxR family transcriptional regulator [Pseudomonas syringae]
MLGKIRRALEAEVCNQGFNKFVLFTAKKSNLNTALFITNYPSDRVENYKKNRSQLHDPIVNYGLNSIAPFSWAECRKQNKRNLENKSQPCVDDTVYTDGYGFTLNDHHGFFSLLCVTDITDSDLTHIERRKADLQMLLIRAHQLLMICPKFINLFFSQSIGNPLTQREHEILSWASLGKTYAEIALITGISERTVKFHMANTVEKLDVSNAKHAISKAQQVGFCRREF